MSTRCQIGIYEKGSDLGSDESILTKFEVLLYRHSDGYPGKAGKDGETGVVPDILPFLREFLARRGYDPEYMGACLAAYLKHWHCGGPLVDKSCSCYREKGNVIVNGFETSPLGHGICRSFHGDIDYFYAITPAALKVYSVRRGHGGTLMFGELESHGLKA